MRRWMVSGWAAAAVVASVVFPASADACDCDPPRTLEAEAKLQQAVVHVRAHLTPAREQGALPQAAFEVLQVLKGQVTTSLLTLDWPKGADCDKHPAEFKDGAEYVLVLKDASLTQVRLSGCESVVAKVEGGQLLLPDGQLLATEELRRRLGAAR